MDGRAGPPAAQWARVQAFALPGAVPTATSTVVPIATPEACAPAMSVAAGTCDQVRPVGRRPAEGARPVVPDGEEPTAGRRDRRHLRAGEARSGRIRLPRGAIGRRPDGRTIAVPADGHEARATRGDRTHRRAVERCIERRGRPRRRVGRCPGGSAMPAARGDRAHGHHPARGRRQACDDAVDERGAGRVRGVREQGRGPRGPIGGGPDGGRVVVGGGVRQATGDPAGPVRDHRSADGGGAGSRHDPARQPRAPVARCPDGFAPALAVRAGRARRP